MANVYDGRTRYGFQKVLAPVSCSIPFSMRFLKKPSIAGQVLVTLGGSDLMLVFLLQKRSLLLKNLPALWIPSGY